MTLVILVFALVLVVTFAVIMLFTRPTAVDRAVENRVIQIHVLRSGDYFGDEVPELFKRTKLSEIDWLDNVLQKWDLARRLRLLLTQAESSWTVPMVFAGSVLLGLVGYGVGYYELPSALVDVLVALVFAAAPYFYLLWQRAQRLKRFNKQLPDAIDLMTRALRAGHSLSAAIEILGEECPDPLRGEFREVYRQQNFGLPAREAMVQLSLRVPSPELRFVVTAMLLQKETGGNLVDILERTVAVIRDRLRIEGEIRIYTAQGRMTGWILSLLPVIMFFLMSLANRTYARVLIDDPTGKKLVYAGLIMMLIGALIIRKIVNIKI